MEALKYINLELLDLFMQGKCTNAYDLFGNHKTEDGKHLFVVWAPNAWKVCLVGDFCDWDADALPMNRLDCGAWAIVIDSADWMMRKIVEQVAGIDSKNLKETLVRSNGGYGAGKQILENEVRSKLLPYLVVLNKKGYGICLIAHAEMKNMHDAEGVDTKQIAPKIDVNTMNAFVEWCDNVFYLKKDVDGSRKLLLESDGVALAKNRLGKTGEVDIDKEDINKILMPQGKEK